MGERLDRDNRLSCTLEIGEAEDNPRRFQVTLKIAIQPKPNAQPAYTGEIHAVGFFRVVDQYPPEKCQKLVETNASALLYGAVRELLINLTARGPWPSVVLKSVTFLPLNAAQKTIPEQTNHPRKTRKSSTKTR